MVGTLLRYNYDMHSSFHSSASSDRLAYARTRDGRTWRHKLWGVRRMMFRLYGDQADELPEFEHVEYVRDGYGKIQTATVQPPKSSACGQMRHADEYVRVSDNGNVTRFAREHEGAMKLIKMQSNGQRE